MLYLFVKTMFTSTFRRRCVVDRAQRCQLVPNWLPRIDARRGRSVEPGRVCVVALALLGLREKLMSIEQSPGNPGLLNRPAEAKFDPRAVHEQLERLLSHELFLHSRRFSTLLRFIVESTVEGRSESLKERIIGIEVFGRTPDYDTSLDASVRVAVAEVRKRLALYYREPEHENELRIELPVRSYLAKFTSPEAHEKFEQPGEHQPFKAPEQQEHEKHPARRRSLQKSYLIGLVLLVVIIGGLYIERTVFRPPVLDRFWAPMLKSSGPVWICLGDDKPHLVSPAPGPGAVDSETPLSQFLKQQPTFPIMDVTAANGITSLLARRGKESDIRVTKATELSDLRGVTVLFLGTFRNDWAVRFGSSLRFQFRAETPTSVNWIEDMRAPGNRQWAVDLSLPYEQVQKDYVLVDRVLDPKTGQWWIGIAGLTGIGTLAAEQMLTDTKAMTALADRLPQNWDRKNLQIVLETPLIKGSPGISRILETYTW